MQTLCDCSALKIIFLKCESDVESACLPKTRSHVRCDRPVRRDTLIKHIHAPQQMSEMLVLVSIHKNLIEACLVREAQSHLIRYRLEHTPVDHVFWHIIDSIFQPEMILVAEWHISLSIADIKLDFVFVVPKLKSRGISCFLQASKQGLFVGYRTDKDTAGTEPFRDIGQHRTRIFFRIPSVMEAELHRNHVEHGSQQVLGYELVQWCAESVTHKKVCVPGK